MHFFVERKHRTFFVSSLEVEFRSLHSVWSDMSVGNRSRPVALFKRHRLSFPEMTFAVCLESFSRSISGTPVTLSIKGGQQISEISFSLTQRNQFRFQVILPPVHLWQLARGRGESTFISVLSARTSCVPSPEHSQSPAHFICTIHTARLSGLNKSKYNQVCIWGERGQSDHLRRRKNI